MSCFVGYVLVGVDRPVDPKTIDTTSANVSDVRKMWQQAAATAPPPMPKTKHGIVLPAAEASSTVHTTGQMDRSAYARNNMTSVRTPSKVSGASSMGSNGGDNNAPVKATIDKPNNQQNQNANRDLPAIGGSSERGEKAGSDLPATPAIPATPTPAPKPVSQASPPSVDFSVEQFNELMEQIDSGDADQKAYAAMELQTMALDSRSQVLMAQNGAIGPLVKLLQPGDPMVQASAAGALWNLAANEHNKFAIAQAGAIQPLVAMLYTDVREAQLSAVHTSHMNTHTHTHTHTRAHTHTYTQMLSTLCGLRTRTQKYRGGSGLAAHTNTHTPMSVWLWLRSLWYTRSDTHTLHTCILHTYIAHMHLRGLSPF